jgi:hypothetical protein
MACDTWSDISFCRKKKGYIEAETEDVVTVEHLHSSSDMENDGRVIIVCP